MTADQIQALQIEREALAALPKRLLILRALLSIGVVLAGCGLAMWDDPDKLWGPKRTFERMERQSGGV